jgi:hypothetical protein
MVIQPYRVKIIIRKSTSLQEREEDEGIKNIANLE